MRSALSISNYSFNKLISITISKTNNRPRSFDLEIHKNSTVHRKKFLKFYPSQETIDLLIDKGILVKDNSKDNRYRLIYQDNIIDWKELDIHRRKEVAKIFLVLKEYSVFINPAPLHNEHKPFDKEVLNKMPENVTELYDQLGNFMFLDQNNKPIDIQEIVNETMAIFQKWLTPNLFDDFVKDFGAVDKHGLSHSLEVLVIGLKVLYGQDQDFKENFDIKKFVMASMIHDLSCLWNRHSHEKHSGNIAKAILEKESLWSNSFAYDWDSEDICDLVKGHKKPLDARNMNMYQRSYYEARVLTDADRLSISANRMFQTHISLLVEKFDIPKSERKTLFFNPEIPFEERLYIIDNNKYVQSPRDTHYDIITDAWNKLRRKLNPESKTVFITEGASKFAKSREMSFDKFLEDYLIQYKGDIQYNLGYSDEQWNELIDQVREIFSRIEKHYFGEN